MWSGTRMAEGQQGFWGPKPLAVCKGLLGCWSPSPGCLHSSSHQGREHTTQAARAQPWQLPGHLHKPRTTQKGRCTRRCATGHTREGGGQRQGRGTPCHAVVRWLKCQFDTSFVGAVSRKLLELLQLQSGLRQKKKRRQSRQHCFGDRRID